MLWACPLMQTQVHCRCSKCWVCRQGRSMQDFFYISHIVITNRNITYACLVKSKHAPTWICSLGTYFTTVVLVKLRNPICGPCFVKTSHWRYMQPPSLLAFVFLSFNVLCSSGKMHIAKTNAHKAVFPIRESSCASWTGWSGTKEAWDPGKGVDNSASRQRWHTAAFCEPG